MKPILLIASCCALFAAMPAITDAATLEYKTFASANGVSVWGEGPGFSVNEREEVAKSWDLGESLGGFEEFLGLKFGARIGAETMGKLGFGYDVKLDSGTFDFQYPGFASIDISDGAAPGSVRLRSGFEAATTLGFNLPITLGGAPERRPPQLQVRGPTAEASVDLFAEAKAFIGAEACAGPICYGPAVSIDGDASREIIAINRNRDAQIRINEEVIAANQPRTFLNGLVVASANIPSLDSSSRTTPGGFDGLTLTSVARDRVANVNANLAQIVANAAGLAIPLSGNEGRLGYNLLQANAGVSADLEQRLEFRPTVTGTYRFSSPVEAIINGVRQAASRIVNFNFGDTIDFITNSLKQITFQPILNFGATIKNELSLLLSGSLSVKAVGADIYGVTLGPLLDFEEEGFDFAGFKLYENSYTRNFGTTRLPVTTLDLECSPAGACASSRYEYFATLINDDGTRKDLSSNLLCLPAAPGRPEICNTVFTDVLDEFGEEFLADEIETSRYFPSDRITIDRDTFIDDVVSALAYDQVNPRRALTSAEGIAALRDIGYVSNRELPPFTIPRGRTLEEDLVSVPEPGSLAVLLLGLGAAALAFRFQRRTAW